jgi:hypothetical protein
MGQGSSGGGWFQDSDTGAVSINSFYYTDDPNTMNGPELSATTLKLYEFVSRGCSDVVRPSGAASPTLAAYDLAAGGSEPNTVMAPAGEEPSSGSVLTHESFGTCNCAQGMGVFVTNQSDGNRLIGVQHTETNQSLATNATTTDYIALSPGEKHLLGCQTTQNSQNQCVADHQYRLSSDRSVASLTPPSPPTAPGVTFATSLGASDINHCVAVCTPDNADPSQCLTLGAAAITALAPLGQFVQNVDKGANTPQGTMLQKSDIITSYGGDPTKDEDPCVRSDVTRVANALQNTGLDCLVRTQSLFPSSQFKTRVQMKTTLSGLPSAWNAQMAPLVSGAPATVFPDRTTGPFIDFEGTATDYINKHFSGDIYAISAISDTRLVLATSNGCIKGPYKQ